MELNQVDIHYLIAAICVISSALIFYTIGVWGERLQRKLKFWHLIFFLLGLLADTVGTSLMEHIAELTHLHDENAYGDRSDCYSSDVCTCVMGDMDLCEGNAYRKETF